MFAGRSGLAVWAPLPSSPARTGCNPLARVLSALRPFGCRPPFEAGLPVRSRRPPRLSGWVRGVKKGQVSCNSFISHSTSFRSRPPLFVKLLAFSDADLLAVLAIVMGEALKVGGAAVEAVGQHIGIDMAAVWQADDVLFDAIRDRELLLVMLAKIGGDTVAETDGRETGGTVKAIIRDHLAGCNGRPKIGHWVPRWLTFPPGTYTERGGVGCIEKATRAAALLASTRPTSTVERDA